MISVVFPLLNEEANLREVHSRISAVAKDLPEKRFEFIFVDDGSTDYSAQILESIAAEDERVKLIRFPRNFGSHSAINAGFRFCSGDVCAVFPCDLQDPPELLPRLLEKWEGGVKVVWGMRENRPQESTFLRFCSGLYYDILKRCTGLSLPENGVDIVLIDRTVIDIINECSEKNSSHLLLISWLGFKPAYVSYTKLDRVAGASKWNFAKRFKLLVDSIVSFSYVPLRLMSGIGIFASAIGILYACMVVLNSLFGKPIEGWSSLMIVVLLIGGFQMLMFGVLGEYLWRTFAESRKRPSYVIEKNTCIRQKVKKQSRTKKVVAVDQPEIGQRL